MPLRAELVSQAGVLLGLRISAASVLANHLLVRQGHQIHEGIVLISLLKAF